MLVFSMYESCCPNTTDVAVVNSRTHGSQRYFDVRVQELRVKPSQANSNLASPSTCIGPPFTAANFTLFVAFVLATPFFRIGHTLLAAPASTVNLHDLLHHVNRGHLLNFQLTFNQLQNAQRVASTRTRHFVRFLLSFACFCGSTFERTCRRDLPEFY